MDYAQSIDADQPKHAAQANPGGHFSPPVDFLFRESLLFTFIHLRRNVSVRIDALRRVHNVGFLVKRLIYVLVSSALKHMKTHVKPGQ